MSNNDARLYRDFDWDGSDTHTHVRTTPHGVFRAVVHHDGYNGLAPESSYDCPVVRIHDGTFRGGVAVDEDYGDESARHDGLSMSLGEAVNRVYRGSDGWSENAGVDDMRQSLEIVDRWLRTFHGGSLHEFGSTVHRGGYDYVTYDTRAMRESWGQTGDMLETSAPSAEEWQAYVDGDVYLVTVEQADDFDDDGEPIGWTEVEGPVGGFYGDDWAAEGALEALDSVIGYTAQNMLPLGE